ncbi:hypothetical protein PDIG_59230 [Penicillium digitatum PHI26]|uniref:Uncharacterized protein n=2 Tax=Penicillium digitatum TaxID=36651 RepID=K9G9P0_PEND2|nr:hypothetical protein PDIP_68680 [Penicillium digitatum Pd1]EKV08363.1 hypothetical protein PDIP_68680 [Penicillium digitatum Pd1]EKV09971.1 hypothetical protein PDIG_59230 [Penicillium digitatum PHI26]
MISHLSETNSLTVRETDEAGNPTATYVYSGDVASSITSSKTPAGRVDVIVGIPVNVLGYLPNTSE